MKGWEGEREIGVCVGWGQGGMGGGQISLEREYERTRITKKSYRMEARRHLLDFKDDYYSSQGELENV